jgi:predicted nucleotidyltransferase
MTSRDYILSSLKAQKGEFQKYGVNLIGLFGSYSRNEQTVQSDVDILIDFEPEMETYDNFMAVYDLLEIIIKGEKIEVVTKNGLSPHIGPSIIKEVVYV